MATSTLTLENQFIATTINGTYDLNNLTAQDKEFIHIYAWPTSEQPSNSPTPTYGGYTMYVVKTGWGTLQIAVYYTGLSIYLRNKFGTSGWGSWRKLTTDAV